MTRLRSKLSRVRRAAPSCLSPCRQAEDPELAHVFQSGSVHAVRAASISYAQLSSLIKANSHPIKYHVAI